MDHTLLSMRLDNAHKVTDVMHALVSREAMITSHVLTNL